MAKDVFAVVMAGGRGTRFWPQSRRRTPKQVLKIVGKKPLIEQTVGRLRSTFPDRNIFVITNRGLKTRIAEHLPYLSRSQIVAEFRAAEPDRVVDVGVADGMIVEGDEHLLRIALRNLLGNAWKFTGTRDHAHIEVAVTVEDGENVYVVRDDGVGFDMSYADKLYLPFQRLHAADAFPGTIGLIALPVLWR